MLDELTVNLEKHFLDKINIMAATVKFWQRKLHSGKSYGNYCITSIRAPWGSIISMSNFPKNHNFQLYKN
jgi:hypothetical protein